ncbi:MAG: hypothetical protein ACHQVS_03490 [Candidatus Babeliales bacterium]
MKVWLLTLTFIVTPVYARIGCLDKSMHLEQRFDYKKYHFVQCNCHCEQAYELMKNGTCTECGHRRDDVLVQFVTTDPTKLVNIAELKKYGNK